MTDPEIYRWNTGEEELSGIGLGLEEPTVNHENTYTLIKMCLIKWKGLKITMSIPGTNFLSSFYLSLLNKQELLGDSDGYRPGARKNTRWNRSVLTGAFCICASIEFYKFMLSENNFILYYSDCYIIYIKSYPIWFFKFNTKFLLSDIEKYDPWIWNIKMKNSNRLYVILDKKRTHKSIFILLFPLELVLLLH